MSYQRKVHFAFSQCRQIRCKVSVMIAGHQHIRFLLYVVSSGMLLTGFVINTCVYLPVLKSSLYLQGFINIYSHLPNIFPIKCVGDPIVFMRAWLHRYVNQHSAIYIVQLSAYEVVDVND